jgi:hypothetical protein
MKKGLDESIGERFKVKGKMTKPRIVMNSNSGLLVNLQPSTYDLRPLLGRDLMNKGLCWELRTIDDE